MRSEIQCCESILTVNSKTTSNTVIVECGQTSVNNSRVRQLLLRHNPADRSLVHVLLRPRSSCDIKWPCRSSTRISSLVVGIVRRQNQIV